MASLLKPQMQCHNNLQFPDSRPRACSHRSLFVRRTPTRPRARGQEPHFTHRLVRSVRCGSRVRQRTLRNLGRHFALPREDWPALCARVERILAPPPPASSPPQRSLELGTCSPAVEDEAQRSAAQLVQAGVSPVGPAAPPTAPTTHPGIRWNTSPRPSANVFQWRSIARGFSPTSVGVTTSSR